MSEFVHLWRNIRRSPISAIAAALTLTLAVGVGAPILAIVDAVLLTPPPFTNPEALVTVGDIPIDDRTATARAVGYTTFQAWHQRAESFAALEAFDGTNLTLTELGPAERVSATDVTPGFLKLLGVYPILGRTFDDDDVGRPVAIVSSTFWRSRLASDTAVIGRQLVLGGQAHTIIGVLPDSFAFALNRCDVWRLLPGTTGSAGFRVRVVARLASGASPRYLEQALDDLSRSAVPPSRIVAQNITTALVAGARPTLVLLATTAAFAALIAFVNLTGLILVRSIDRRRELAVRSALGAPHPEIAKQVLLEAFTLVTLGTVSGVLLALWLTPAAARFWFEQFGGVANHAVVLSWRLIAAIGCSGFISATICGLIPAVHASRWSVIDGLRGGVTPARDEIRLRRIFVTAEIALAFVFLISMALVGRSLLSVLNMNPGFDPRDVLTLQISLPTRIYSTDDRVASFYLSLQRVLESRLGAGAVSIVDELPLTGDRGRNLVGVSRADARQEAVMRTISPGYFDVMRIPLTAGRSFVPSDSKAIASRVVISQALAKVLFPREPAVGRQMWLAARAEMAEVVGVAGDVTHRALDERMLPTVYLSAWQVPSPSSIVVARSPRPSADVFAAVREEVARMDSSLPVYNVRPMQDIMDSSPGVPERRLLTAVFTTFACLAVVLSGIGLFGVAAHDVASRRVEFALRMAVGANTMHVLGIVLRRTGVMLIAGLIVGGGVSIVTTRALGDVILPIGPVDSLTTAAAAVFAAGLLIAATASAVLPAALRATRIEVGSLLRGE